MKEFLGPERLANKIRQLREVFPGAVLILEGDTDARVYRRYIVGSQCSIEIAHNKDNAIRGLTILEQEPFVGVLAIVDADFQRLEDLLSSSPNLLLTDTHDLETMMLRSPALNKVLAEFGSAQKIATLVAQAGKALPEVLLAAAVPIGYLRWFSLRQNLALKFEQLDFGKFVVGQLLTTNVPALIQTVKNKSQQPGLDAAEVQKQLAALQNESHDHWQVCCGHDLLEILSVGLRNAIGGAFDTAQIKAEVSFKLPNYTPRCNSGKKPIPRSAFWREDLENMTIESGSGNSTASGSERLSGQATQTGGTLAT